MRVRSAVVQDAPRILEIYSPYVENTAISFECTIPKLDEIARRIEHALETHAYIVLEEDGVIQGYAYAGYFKARAAYDHSSEVSIYLDQSASGKGYGRILYTELENRLKERGILNLYACIASPIVEDEYLTRNSERFHAHLGYTTVGEFHKCAYKFGRWYNMIWMEKIIGEHAE